MPIISRRSIDEIRQRNDVVDVIGSYLTLKKSGSAFKTCCPFHKEKTPSFHVNPERQIFHCFGCGAGGDVLRFVMQHENVDFMEAARILAERAKIQIEYEKGGPVETTGGPDKNTLYEMMEELAQFYHRVLLTTKQGEAAREYVTSRKLPDDIVKRFLIGYAPDGWDNMLKWAEKHKCRPEQLEAAGMILKSTKPNARSAWYDRFRDRLMFPIRNAQGKIIGFSGRTLKSDKDEAKYVNSPDSVLFHKSQVLYALYEAKKEIVEKREAIICEGQIDVIRCHQAGFINAVAGQGTAFTEEHARIVKRSADSVVLVYDSDVAGQNAAIKTAVVFLQAGLAVRVASLPKGTDPDSFIRDKGAGEFQKLLDAAVPVVAFQTNVLKERENIRTEAGLMRVSKEVLQTIAMTPNAVQRAKMIQQAGELLGIPPRALEDELRHVLRKQEISASSRRNDEPNSGGAGAGADGAEQPRADGKPPPEEMSLAEHIVAMPELGVYVDNYLAPGMISDPMCAKIIQAAVTASKDNRDFMSVVSEMDDANGNLTRLAAQVQMAPSKATGGETSREQAVKDLVLYLWRHRLTKERNEIERKTKTGEIPRADMERLRQIPFDLKALRDWELGSHIIEVELPSS